MARRGAGCVFPLYGAPVTAADTYADARLSTVDEIAVEIRRVKRTIIDPNPLAHLQVGAHPSTELSPEPRRVRADGAGIGVPLNVHPHESRANLATWQVEWALAGTRVVFTPQWTAGSKRSCPGRTVP